MTSPGGAAGPARVIDGVATAREIYVQLKERVTALGRLDVRPRLVAIQVGDHPASRIYLRNKVRACSWRFASRCARICWSTSHTLNQLPLPIHNGYWISTIRTASVRVSTRTPV